MLLIPIQGFALDSHPVLELKKYIPAYRLGANTSDESTLLLFIMQQSGSLEKAILEATMNSEDAGADTIEIELTGNRVIITDNGKVFQTREEIRNCFLHFANPHMVDDDGRSTDAKFGRFRIGRGQMFAYGVNRWRSGTFLMETDTKTNILGAHITDKLENVKGCRIEIDLYDPEDIRSLGRIEAGIERYIRYTESTVTLNGTRVNTPASQKKWDKENDWAWVDIAKAGDYGGINFYQQGVFVENIPRYAYGVSGTVVTKKQLVLNTARNEVIRKSEGWKEITKLLKEEQRNAVVKLKDRHIDPAMRRSLIDQVKTCFKWKDDEHNQREYGMYDLQQELKEIGIASAQLIRMTSRDMISFNQFKLWTTGKRRKYEAQPDNNVLVTVAQPRDERARALEKTRQAMVVSQEALDEWGMDIHQLLRLVKSVTGAWELNAMYMPMEEILDMEAPEFSLFGEDQLYVFSRKLGKVVVVTATKLQPARTEFPLISLPIG